MYTMEVVLEDLRQLIIFGLDPVLWWKYSALFGEDCAKERTRNIKECSLRTQQKAGFSENTMKKIETTFNNSFIKEKSETEVNPATQGNTIMEKER